MKTTAKSTAKQVFLMRLREAQTELNTARSTVAGMRGLGLWTSELDHVGQKFDALQKYLTGWREAIESGVLSEDLGHG